jgi:hypothetical protein
MEGQDEVELGDVEGCRKVQTYVYPRRCHRDSIDRVL